MSPSRENIIQKQSARQEAARKRIASHNHNENTDTDICPHCLVTTAPSPKTPPRPRDLLKFNGEGKKWKTPEGRQKPKPIDRLTFDRKEASVAKEAVSPMLLALGGGDDDVVIDRSAVGRRVACYNRVGELHFGKVDDVYAIGKFGKEQWYAIKYDEGGFDDIPENKLLAATKLYVKEQANDPLHGLKRPAKSTKRRKK